MKQEFLRLIKDASHRYDSNMKSISKTRDLINKKVPLTEIDNQAFVRKRIIRLGKDEEIGKERLIGGNNLVSISYLETGIRVSKSVCRIVWQNNFGSIEPLGTGFLISPQLIMTNNHVIPDKETAESVSAQFDYECDSDGKLKNHYSFRLEPERFFVTSPSDDLDYTIVAIGLLSRKGKPVEEFGWNKLIPTIGKVVKGEALTIIQHPNGEPKQIALQENKLIERDEKFLFYETDTNAGSSGAPVYNNQWEIVALHRSGVPERNKDGNILTTDGEVFHSSMGEHKISWIANEGVRISKILGDFNNRNLDEPQEALRKELNEIAEYIAPIDGEITFNTVTLPSRSRFESLFHDNTKNEISQNIRYEIQITSSEIIVHTVIQELHDKFNKKPSRVFTNEESNYNELKWFYELELITSKDPWVIASDIKSINGIENVDIDLPSLTHTAPDDYLQNGVFSESLTIEETSNKLDKESHFKGLHPTWNHKATKFPEALKLFNERNKQDTATKIRVAQIDTGYTGHPEIASVNSAAGYDYADWDSNAYDEYKRGILRHPGHGTRTASVIIGEKTKLIEDRNNGVYSDVDYVPFRVANSPVLIRRGKNVSAAIEHILGKQFDIITMSMGSVLMRSWKVLAEMAYNQGVFWICAAGNQVKFVVNPASFKGTIAVAATNYKDGTWKGSSRGRKVDIAAPGEDVFVPRATSDRDLTYNYGSGTSYATPHITAAAALWLNYHGEEINKRYVEPWQRVEAFRECLSKSARKPSNWDSVKYGAGILNAVKLLKTTLPNPNKLKHAYDKHSKFTESSKRYTTMAEKEIVYKVWNADLLGKEALQFSPVAKSLVDTISSSKDFLLEDGTSPIVEYAVNLINNIE